MDSGPPAAPVTARRVVLPLAECFLLTACATVPTGPSVLVLPGTAKNFEQFQTDDAVCRQWALQQTGTTPNEAGAASTVTGRRSVLRWVPGSGPPSAQPQVA